MRQALVERISQTQRHQTELVGKLNALKASSPSPTTVTLHLWTQSTLGNFDWDPKPNRELFESLSLPVLPQDEEGVALEKRIQQIREELLTPYPPIPDPSAPRLSSLEARQTAKPSRATPSQVTESRSIQRKSIRSSMARKGRPSLFRIGGMQDVVNQVSKYLGNLFSHLYITRF